MVNIIAVSNFTKVVSNEMVLEVQSTHPHQELDGTTGCGAAYYSRGRSRR
jgi:hypothetical protein